MATVKGAGSKQRVTGHDGDGDLPGLYEKPQLVWERGTGHDGDGESLEDL